MQTIYLTLAYAARLKDIAYTRKVNRYLTSKLPRKLPFAIYLDIEVSTPETIILRVEHRTGGTSNRVVIKLREKRRPGQRVFDIDATNGSNWHHLKWDFTQWLKNALPQGVPCSYEPCL